MVNCNGREDAERIKNKEVCKVLLLLIPVLFVVALVKNMTLHNKMPILLLEDMEENNKNWQY